MCLLLKSALLCVQNLEFGIDCDSRVALVGPNGAGVTHQCPSDPAMHLHAAVHRCKSLQYTFDYMFERSSVQATTAFIKIVMEPARPALWAWLYLLNALTL